MNDKSERLEPIVVETRRGADHLHTIRQALARVELTDGMTFAGMLVETVGRLPRDATVIAVLGDVSVETAAALGTLRRAGFALTAILIALDGKPLERAHGRLSAEGVGDVRHLPRLEALPHLCQQQAMGRGQFMFGTAAEPDPEEEGPDWARQTPYELGSPED